MTKNNLYYGDYIQDESVDLVYLDPPFKSDQDYNVLFAEQDGSRAAAQIKAFGDMWQWDEASARAYQDVVEAGGQVSQVLPTIPSACPLRLSPPPRTAPNPSCQRAFGSPWGGKPGPGREVALAMEHTPHVNVVVPLDIEHQVGVALQRPGA